MQKPIISWNNTTPALLSARQITARSNQISIVSIHIPSLVKIDIYSSYHPETKIQTCGGKITLSKIDNICPLAIPDQISTISMHIPSLNWKSNSHLHFQRKCKKLSYFHSFKILFPFAVLICLSNQPESQFKLNIRHNQKIHWVVF